MSKDEKPAFDEALYNRQVYAVGAAAQSKYSITDVLLVGMSGMGCEIAKNLILTGIRSITLVDETSVSWSDLSTNFYATAADATARTNRVDAVLKKLSELNTYVKIVKGDVPYAGLTLEEIAKYTVVVLCDQSYSDPRAIQIDQWCRSSNVRFISCEARGLSANIFIDLGDEFIVFDKNGDEFPSCIVTMISPDGVVMCHDDLKHNLEDGDVVQFTELTGPLADICTPGKVFKVKAVTSPFFFTLEIPEGAPKLEGYVRGGMVQGVKTNQKMAFKSLASQIAEPEVVYSDFGKFDAPPQLHLFFQALHRFSAKNKRLPGAGSADAAAILADIKTLNTGNVDIDEPLMTNFANTAAGSFVGITALIGGLTAHEVLKACSGKFTPIKQWYFFDARECLPSDVSEAARAPRNSRYDGQIAIFGDALQKVIQSQRYFIVGAGALGCEMLKNFAVSGLGCSPEGRVFVTDMDTIEKSNLSRQFLFRSNDIGKLKSECAGAAAKAMNSDFNLKAMQDKVAPETSETFNDDFWENLTGVCTALDNVQARMYVDNRCVYYRRPMVDSGTLGGQANAQVVIPNVTESYSSSTDPPEKTIPVCTLKNFPSQIEHTIQWARDALEGLFNTQITEVKQYLTNPEFMKQLDKEPGMKPSIMLNVSQTLTGIPETFDDCIVFARARFEEYFNNNIVQLLHNFPVDTITPSGAPFWSGPKRPPTPYAFDAADVLHVDFVQAAAQLRAFTFSVVVDPAKATRAYIAAGAAKSAPPRFEPKKIKIATEAPKEGEAAPVEAAPEVEISEKDLPPAAKFANLVSKLRSVDFEKDDDANFHIAFVTACSNLRAANYKLAPADFAKTKMIAGRIIPAMVTTTALATGIVMLEIIKIVTIPKEKWNLQVFRNAFINLAVSFTAFSDPIAPAVVTYGPPSNPKERSWTLWDRFEIDFGKECTLGELFAYFKEKHNLDVQMMSCGTCMIYSFFGATSKARLPMKVSDAVRDVAKVDFPASQKYLTFEVCCSIDDADCDVPAVRYRFRF